MLAGKNIHQPPRVFYRREPKRDPSSWQDPSGLASLKPEIRVKRGFADNGFASISEVLTGFEYRGDNSCGERDGIVSGALHVQPHLLVIAG